MAQTADRTDGCGAEGQGDQEVAHVWADKRTSPSVSDLFFFSKKRKGEDGKEAENAPREYLAVPSQASIDAWDSSAVGDQGPFASESMSMSIASWRAERRDMAGDAGAGAVRVLCGLSSYIYVCVCYNTWPYTTAASRKASEGRLGAFLLGAFFLPRQGAAAAGRLALGAFLRPFQCFMVRRDITLALGRERTPEEASPVRGTRLLGAFPRSAPAGWARISPARAIRRMDRFPFCPFWPHPCPGKKKTHTQSARARQSGPIAARARSAGAQRPDSRPRGEQSMMTSPAHTCLLGKAPAPELATHDFYIFFIFFFHVQAAAHDPRPTRQSYTLSDKRYPVPVHSLRLGVSGWYAQWPLLISRPACPCPAQLTLERMPSAQGF